MVDIVGCSGDAEGSMKELVYSEGEGDGKELVYSEESLKELGYSPQKIACCNFFSSEGGKL